MRFSTSNDKFQEKASIYVCKVNAPDLNTIGIS